MTREIQGIILSAVPLILQLTGLLFAVLVDPYIGKGKRRLLLLVVLADFLLILQNCLDSYLNVCNSFPYGRILTGIFGYCLRPLILLLFIKLVDSEKKQWAAFFLILLNGLISLTALFSDMCFTITEDNHFQRGPLGFTCHIVSIVLLICLLYLTMQRYRGVKYVPVFNAVLIIAAIVIDGTVDLPFDSLTMLTTAVVICSLFYYIWLHLKFALEHENALMAEQRIQIMVSQIQPHFLYNTLSSIQYLCMSDPGQAALITGKFAKYLRQNLDSLGQTELIPVKRELEHVAVYAEIEKVRFPHIHVEYDVSDEDFKVPALTIQPLVENAIRHGNWEEGEGRITVTIRKGEAFHEILIEDDGMGFDPAQPGSADKSHVGIKNVCERVEKMCHGSLTVDSAIGSGTRIRIVIPEVAK